MSDFAKDTNVYSKDVVYRQDAINLLKKWADGYKYIETETELAIKEFEQLPSAQRWIPCRERLPEKAYGQYWVCTDTGYQCQCRWTDNVYGLYPSGEWSWKIFDIPQYSHVVAWMPLPESYKGEQE